MFAINLPISRRRIRKVGAAKSNYWKTGDDLADFQKKCFAALGRRWLIALLI